MTDPLQTPGSWQRSMLEVLPFVDPPLYDKPAQLTPAQTESIQLRAQQATSDPQQRELLIDGWTQAQSTGDASLARQTDELAQLYHDREVLSLSRSLGTGTGAGDQPPAGWVEASHPTPAVLERYGVDNAEQLLAQFGLSSAELHPQGGDDFNAELYLPDPAVYGPDAQPVLAFEGTNFADPNDVNADVAQAMGHPEAYYNRAMSLAQQVNQHTGGQFEITGHSLGGGLATAAGLVTGATTIVSNPAGVHPDTIERFTSERGLTPQGDGAVRSYVVDGDILTGLQNATANLSADNADGLAAIFNGVTMAYNEVNNANLPTDATGEQLRELPDAAGQTTTLPAFNADGSARPDIVELDQVLASVGALADGLSIPGEVAEDAGGFAGWLGDRVDDVTNAIGGGADWLADRLPPGTTRTLIDYGGHGIETLGDGIDNLGEIARQTGQSVADVNRTLAVGLSGAIVTGTQADTVIPSFGEMVERHSAGVAYGAMDHHIDGQEADLREALER